MNSLKILVNSWDSLYPPAIGRDPEEEGEDKPLLDDLDIRASVDNDREGRAVSEKGSERGVEEVEAEDEDVDVDVDDAAAAGGDGIVLVVLFYVLFLPNYIIIKPITFLWLLITFPFTYLFEDDKKKLDFIQQPQEQEQEQEGEQQQQLLLLLLQQQQDDDDSLLNANATGEIATEENKVIEILKQENLISNTIKSPSSSSKYLIPPPIRLFPLSRNPQKKRKRKTLILDLDETLIHSLSRGSPRSFNTSNGSSNMIEIKLNNIASLYYVYKRPYCDYFLREAAKWFELQVFTASVKEYADPIINWLESEISPYVQQEQQKQQQQQQQNGVGDKKLPSVTTPVFTKRYYRTDCTYRPGVGYIKDLSKFFPRDEDLKNVIILDNSPVSYALHEDNAVMIEGWINDQSDRDLLNLLPMLHSLSLCIDVRYILGLRGGEKVFEN